MEASMQGLIHAAPGETGGEKDKVTSRLEPERVTKAVRFDHSFGKELWIA
jgi:hypothetical protein